MAIFGLHRACKRLTAFAFRALLGFDDPEASVEERSALETATVATRRAFAQLVAEASTTAAQALRHADAGDRNTAIGTLADIDRLLEDATAMRMAAIALHTHLRTL